MTTSRFILKEILDYIVFSSSFAIHDSWRGFNPRQSYMYYNIKIINSFIVFIVLSLVFKIIKTGSLKSKLALQEKSYLFRTSLYLAASASAEFFADIALAPMEAVKVRIQTQPGWANNLREGAPKLWAEEGIRGYVDFWMPKNDLASRLDYQLLFGKWACPGEGRRDRNLRLDSLECWKSNILVPSGSDMISVLEIHQILVVLHY